ncbi:MAG: hypothetical protein RUMPE_00812 [Eubacteriales bacterium SKADARSKE-1]|nr:hypothetical protein [Eubacteriales bacterium SKADARSKE-1]
MKVEECLLALEEVLEDSWSLPLTKGKAFVDVEKIRELSEDLKEALPDELSQAKAIVADRTQIISDAKEEAASIIEKAEDKARIIIGRDELVKQAEIKSENILLEAQVKARDIKKAANDYVDDIMKRADEVLMSNISELREARKDLRGAQRS